MKKATAIASTILISTLIILASFILAKYDLPKTSSRTETPLATPVITENSKPNLFDAKLDYVYVGLANGSVPDYHDYKMYPANYYPLLGVINLTYLGTPENSHGDLMFESYVINVVTDTGMRANYITWGGTNLNQSAVKLTFPTPFSSRYLFFDYNLKINKTYQLPFGDGGASQSWNGSLGLWQNGVPNEINVTLQRGDWVVISGNSSWTVTNPDKNVILQQIDLVKSENGFIFSYGSY